MLTASAAALVKRGLHYLNISFFAGGTSDFILPYLQIESVIGNGLLTIRTTIGKPLNPLLF